MVSPIRDVAALLRPAARPGDFLTAVPLEVPGASSPASALTLTPFYRTHRRSYSIYFDLVTPAEYDARGAALEVARATAVRLEAATVGRVTVGDTASERSANYRSEPADRVVGRTEGRTQRGGAGWMSYDLAVDPAVPMRLVVTYQKDPGLPTLTGDFAFVVDGTRIASYRADQRAYDFYDESYDVPGALTQGKTKVTVRVEAGPAGRIVPIFAIRMVKR